MANTKQTTEKIPPQNIEAEQSLLSCLIIDKDAIIKIIDSLSEYDFYKKSQKDNVILNSRIEEYANIYLLYHFIHF